MVTRGNVLVVDDEINLCRILGAKLAKNGYSVVAVHDGLQAIEKVRESEFDVVLLDLILPKMDGLTALAKIRSMRSGLPVIVMTACENADALEQARNHGVSAYVNKPFDLDSLVSLVKGTSRTKSPASRNLPQSTVLFIKDQPITMEIQNGGGARIYESHICLKSDHTLSVCVPVVDGKVLDVKPKTAVRIGLAAKDAYYSFTSHVVMTEYNDEPTLVLEKPGVIYRSQRRQGQRIIRRIPLNYALCDDSGGLPDYKQGETRDIGLGGAKIAVDENVAPGEILKVELRPKSEKDAVSLIAQVLRSRRNDVPDEQNYIIGCRFTGINDSIRKLLEE